MNIREAATTLGVQLEGLTENALSIAFARAVRLAHPDTGGGREGSVEALDKAKKARNMLREFIEKGGLPPPCHQCNGKGHVYGRFGNATCPRCKGRG